MPHEDAISYEDWGAEFFREALSERRILEAAGTVAGQPIDFGPVAVGPAGLARVRAFGETGAPEAVRLDGEPIAYRVLLPVDLTVEVDLQLELHRFRASLLVPVTVSVIALGGVRIFIDATAPTSREVEVEVRAQGLRATVLQRVADIEGELRRFVARHVSRQLEEPHVREARLIDVSRAIDRAWASLPGSPDQRV